MYDFSPLSDPLAPPLPLTAPTLTVAVVNSSAVALSWEAPPPSSNREILGYDLVYTRPDGTLSNPALGEGRLNFTIADLSPGMHTFNISARYRQGLGPADSVSVLLEGEAVSEGVVGQPWFYALISGAGVIMVVLIIILLLCICYQLCCRKDKGQTTPTLVRPHPYYTHTVSRPHPHC